MLGWVVPSPRIPFLRQLRFAQPAALATATKTVIIILHCPLQLISLSPPTVAFNSYMNFGCVLRVTINNCHGTSNGHKYLNSNFVSNVFSSFCANIAYAGCKLNRAAAESYQWHSANLLYSLHKTKHTSKNRNSKVQLLIV